MSHFTVLVIGQDPEKQLAPYHEYECTGDDNEYVQDVDIKDEILAHMKEENVDLKTALAYHGIEGDSILAVGDSRDNKACKYHYAYVENGKLLSAFNHTNPNAKWDWYRLGGRWTGFFKLNSDAEEGTIGTPGLMTEPAEEGFVDQALKGHIDFESIANKAGEEARELYRKVMKAAGDSPMHKTWEQVRAEIPDIDQARNFYNSQEFVKKIRDGGDDREFIWLNPDEFLCTEADYVHRAKRRAYIPFAIIKDGKWYEKGSMGWWGAVSNEKNQNEWNDQIHKMIEELPDDTLLSVYDCHI